MSFLMLLMYYKVQLESGMLSEQILAEPTIWIMACIGFVELYVSGINSNVRSLESTVKEEAQMIRQSVNRVGNIIKESNDKKNTWKY